MLSRNVCCIYLIMCLVPLKLSTRQHWLVNAAKRMVSYKDAKISSMFWCTRRKKSTAYFYQFWRKNWNLKGIYNNNSYFTPQRKPFYPTSNQDWKGRKQLPRTICSRFSERTQDRTYKQYQQYKSNLPRLWYDQWIRHLSSVRTVGSAVKWMKDQCKLLSGEIESFNTLKRKPFCGLMPISKIKANKQLVSNLQVSP